MQTTTLLDGVLEEFNRFFQGSAEAVMNRDELRITVGS